MLNKNNKQFTSDWIKAVKIFYTVSGWIVGPVIFAVIIGNWLDNKYQNEYFFTLTLVGIAFTITCIGIVREVKKAIDDLK